MKYFIWGIGEETKKLLKCRKEFKGELIGFLQSVKSQNFFYDKPVFMIEEIEKYSWDYIIVTSSLYADEIYAYAKRNGITDDKLCFLHLPQNSYFNMNDNLRRLWTVIPEKYLIDIEGYKNNEEFDFILKDLKTYNLMNTREEFRYKEEYKDFLYYDKYTHAGSIHNYFWQDLWAARLIYKNKVQMHYDIGSRIDGFIAHLLSFGQDVTLIDVRPLDKQVEGLQFVNSDATNLNEIENNSIESISALCSLEHFGLGRYGDPIDPEACFKAFETIGKKVRTGGHVYISVPIGQDHLEFNGCRVFYAETIIKAFPGMRLVEFSTVYNGEMEYNADIHSWDNFSEARAVCYGLFHFQKYIDKFL